MDSQALELLCRWHEALKNRGCLLKLSGLNEFCRTLLAATRLTDVFNVYGDCMEAARN
jgi:anti-anti-sigma regulatory factor